MRFSLSEYTKIDVSWGFVPDPTESLQRSPRLPSCFQGGRFAAGREWRGEEGRTRGGEKRGTWEVRGNGEWKRKGKLGGIAPWLLGIDAPGYLFSGALKMQQYDNDGPDRTT